MLAARIVFAVLIAISVAILPRVGVSALAAGSTDTSMSGGDTQGMPCKKAADDCRKLAGCALKCFNFFGAGSPGAWIYPPSVEPQSSFVTNALHSYSGDPPFRPPPM